MNICDVCRNVGNVVVAKKRGTPRGEVDLCNDHWKALQESQKLLVSMFVSKQFWANDLPDPEEQTNILRWLLPEKPEEVSDGNT